MLGRIGMGWAAYQLRWRIVQSLYGRLIEALREYGVVEKRIRKLANESSVESVRGKLLLH